MTDGIAFHRCPRRKTPGDAVTSDAIGLPSLPALSATAQDMLALFAEGRGEEDYPSRLLH